jgi:hypothetical protein
LQVRRFLSVFALLGGLAAAWWQSRTIAEEVTVAWLLNHVAVSVDGVVVDRQRLTAIGWRIPDHEPKVWNWQHFPLGQAPDLADPVVLKLPNDVTQLEIACRLQLLPGAPPLRTYARIPVPARAGGVIPVDVEGCGEVVR